MRTAAEWLDEYGVSHRNPTNELLHWICVPVDRVVRGSGCCGCLPFPVGVHAAHS